MNKLKVELLKKSIEKTIEKMHCKSEIIAVFLFGSGANYSNENFNKNSDLDIMMLVEETFDYRFEDNFESLLKNELEDEKLLDKSEESFVNIELDVTIYNMKKFKELLISGALFMLHINNDAIMMYSHDSSTKEQYFEELKEFKGLYEDIFVYGRMLNSLSRSIDKNGVNFFDLSILGMIVRNTLIIANYHAYKNKTKFDKFDVFKILDKKTTCLTMGEYEEMLLYKSFYNRNAPKIVLPDLNTKALISNVSKLILQVQEDLGAVDAVDRLYFILDDNNTRNLYSSFEFFCDFDRALYMNLRKYLKQKYKIDLHSVKSKYLRNLELKYSNDKLIMLTRKLSEYEKKLKRYSSNYRIRESSELENDMDFTDDFKTILNEYRIAWREYLNN